MVAECRGRIVVWSFVLVHLFIFRSLSLSLSVVFPHFGKAQALVCSWHGENFIYLSCFSVIAFRSEFVLCVRFESMSFVRRVSRFVSLSENDLPSSRIGLTFVVAAGEKNMNG